MLEIHRLPDQLRPNLRLVFVGTAASMRSAEVGHYYAHPGNRFWRALHEAGITPRRYQPSEFASLIDLGIGFTDLCKTGAGMDHQIAAETIDVPGFRAKIETYRPRTIAFTSKKAASLFYGRPSRAIALAAAVGCKLAGDLRAALALRRGVRALDDRAVARAGEMDGLSGRRIVI